MPSISQALGWRFARVGRVVVTACLLLTSVAGDGVLRGVGATPQQRPEHESVEAESSSQQTKRPSVKMWTAHLANEREEASGDGPSLSDVQPVSARQGRVPKTVFSENVRLLGLVGLEGAGHHFFYAAIADMFETRRIQTLSAGNTGSMSLIGSREETAIRRNIKEVASAKNSIQAPGTIVHLNLQSYPTGFRPDKTIVYPDVRLLAEIAEDEGLDFRIIYLQRPAKEILLSDINHRHFENYNGLPSSKNATQKMEYYARVLFTDLGVMSSMLQELDPGFIMCFSYDDITNVEQATEIGKFVAPTAELASFFTESMLNIANKTDDTGESLLFSKGDQMAERLQKKCDSFEPMYCST